jgi:segregation and condensation protein B
MTDENLSNLTSEEGVASNADEVRAAEETSEQVENTDALQAEAVKKLSQDQQAALLEALLLAHGDPIGLQRLQEIFHCTKAELLVIVDRVEKSCSEASRGIEVVVVAGKLQLRTKAEYAEFVRALMAVKPRRLSQAALETLSVVAYRQPIVKSEIDKIRGVDVAPTIKTLIDRKLIKILGYQASVGQPALYGTTDEFLQVFGLGGLAELPALRDLKALAKEPGEAQESTEREESEGEASEQDAVSQSGDSATEDAPVVAS